MDIKLENIIKNSGNNLHLEIAQYLEQSGWRVDLSSYYYDDTTNKPREIDIVARKHIEITDIRGSQVVDAFEVCLFIECKYFKNEIAFRLHQNSNGENTKGIIVEGFNKDELMYQTGLENSHHYLNVEKVAKLYDAQSDEQNDIFNAITQPIKSLVFFKDREPKKGFYYPVVVYSGINGIYPVEQADLANLQGLQQLKNIIFGVNYSYRSTASGALENQYFCVDFVHKGDFQRFLQFVDSEMGTVRKSLAFQARKRTTST